MNSDARVILAGSPAGSPDVDVNWMLLNGGF
jgi:hypothetical protein